MDRGCQLPCWLLMHVLREWSFLQWLEEGKPAKSTQEGCWPVWSSKPYPTPPRIIHGQACTSPQGVQLLDNAFTVWKQAPCSLLHCSFSLDSARVTSAAAVAAPGVAHAHASKTLCVCARLEAGWGFPSLLIHLLLRCEVKLSFGSSPVNLHDLSLGKRRELSKCKGEGSPKMLLGV